MKYNSNIQLTSFYFIFHFLLISACTYSQIEPNSSGTLTPEKVKLLAIRQHKAQGYSKEIQKKYPAINFISEFEEATID